MDNIISSAIVIPMHKEQETWLPIPEWEGYYEVSNFGRVKSIERIRARRNRWGGVTYSVKPEMILKATSDKLGYPRVALYADGVKLTTFPHRLVCRAFHGPAPKGKPFALHIDGNPGNPRWDNVRWGSPKENTADRIRHGTDASGVKNARAKLTEDQVREVRSCPDVPMSHFAKRFNVCSGTIQHIRTGRNWASVA